MHRIFGEKLSCLYTDRKGAYLIPVESGKIAVIKTPKGLFFLGGGIEKGETDSECIIRECLEEAGHAVKIGEKICSAETYTEHSIIGHFHFVQTYYSGTLLGKIKEPTESDHVLEWHSYEELEGKMFSEMQNWALQEFVEKQSGK